MQRMESENVSPLMREWMRCFVAFDHVGEMRRSEQVKGREVIQTVAGIRRGINQHCPLGIKKHVARPQITVDTCGRLVVIKITGAQPRHETPENFALLRVEQIPRRAHERVDPRIREHRAPRKVLAFLREGKRKLLARGPLETVSPPRAAFGIDRPEPETPLATLTRAAATSAMRHGECRAKVARRTRARCTSP